jgi:hypothetical protein
MNYSTVKSKVKQLKEKISLFLLPCEQNDYRAKIFTGNFLIFFLIAIAIFKLGFALFLNYFPNNQFYADITKTALVDMANAERAKQNLPELTENPVLDQAAYMKALDMAENGYFNHISPAGVNPWHWFDQAGYNYKYAGENLAIGFVDSSQVQDAWIASPTHKANIINNKYKEIGIAVLKASFQGNPATIVVQLFGRPASPLSALPAIGGVSQGDTGTKEQMGHATISGNFGNHLRDASASQGGTVRDVLGAQTATVDENSFLFKTASFFSQNFYNWLQAIIYGSLILIILLLLVNFFFKADFDHADLLAKAICFVIIMGIFAMFDHSLLAVLI